jgi:hypothetical protein
MPLCSSTIIPPAIQRRAKPTGASTRRLVEAAQLLQVRLLDHIIVGAPCDGRLPYFSFRRGRDDAIAMT